VNHIYSSTGCKLKLVVLIFAILVQHQVLSNPAYGYTDTYDCECTGITLYDGNLRREVGNCLVKAPSNNRYYCYISPSSGCSDKRKSSRASGLFYSYQACVNQANNGGGAAAAYCPGGCWLGGGWSMGIYFRQNRLNY